MWNVVSFEILFSGTILDNTVLSCSVVSIVSIPHLLTKPLQCESKILGLLFGLANCLGLLIPYTACVQIGGELLQ